MAIFTITDLAHLTRQELCDLAKRIEQTLTVLEAGSLDRTQALVSLETIRRTMHRRGFHF